MSFNSANWEIKAERYKPDKTGDIISRLQLGFLREMSSKVRGQKLHTDDASLTGI